MQLGDFLNYLLPQVGAVLVNPDGDVVGKGWNRMPEGCEEMFQWDRDRNNESLDKGKHLYGEYISLLSHRIIM